MTTVVCVDLSGRTTNRTVLAIARGVDASAPVFEVVSRMAGGRHLPDVGYRGVAHSY